MVPQDSSDKIANVATGHRVVLSTECFFTDANEGITDTPLLNTSGLVHPEAEAEQEAVANMASEANQITANSLTVTNSTSLVVQTASTIAATSTLQSVAATKAVQTTAGSASQITLVSSNIGQATFNNMTNSTTLGISTTAAATLVTS